MAYTSDEIQSAVEKIVLSTIRKPYGTLGVRRTDLSFSDIQQATAGSFILYPTSPFYCVALGAKRLLDVVAAEAGALEAVSSAVAACANHSFPIQDVSTLFNAKAALEALEGAVSTSAPRDITKLPQYQRFDSNVASFLDTGGASVRASNAGYTPQAARSALPALLATLQAQHAELLRRVALLINAIYDYGQVNLPSLVARGIISRARTVLAGHADEMNAASPEDRLLSVRDVVLDLLTARASVRTFGSFNGPSPFYSISGVGTPFSDDQHLATPALLLGTQLQPYTITSGVNDTLVLTLEGVPVTATLPPSRFAVLQGGLTESLYANSVDGYLVGDGTHPNSLGAAPSTSNHFRFNVVNRALATTTLVDTTLTLATEATKGAVVGALDVTGLAANALDGTSITLDVDGTSYTVTFTPGNANPSSALLAQFNTVLGTHAVATTDGSGHLVVTSGSFGGSSFVLVLPGGTATTTLGLVDSQLGTGTWLIQRTAAQVAGEIQARIVALSLDSHVVAEPYFQQLHFSGKVDVSGASGSNATFTIPGANIPGPVYIPQPVYSGTFAGVVVGDYISIAAGPNAGLWTVTTTDGLTPSVSLTATKQSGSATNETGRSIEVGFKDRAVRVRVFDPLWITQEVHLDVLSDTAAARGANQLLGFSTGQSSSCTPSSAQDLADSINRQTTRATAAPVQAGVSVAFVTDPINPLHLTAQKKAGTGDVVFAAGSPNHITLSLTSGGLLAAGVGVGDIVVLPGSAAPTTGWTITAFTDSLVVATSTSTVSTTTGAAFIIGADISGVHEWTGLVVTTGPNKGNYNVDTTGTPSPLDVVLKSGLPQYSNPSTNRGVVFTGTLGEVALSVSSADRTTASHVVVTGSAQSTLFGASTAARGSTPWFQLPTGSPSPISGDLLETYASQYNLPDAVYTIESSGFGILAITPDIPDLPTWTFGDQPTPFARVRVGHYFDFTTFQELLQAWLLLPINQPTYFSNLNRFLNPLLVSTNPTVEQVSSAENQLLLLQHTLTIAGATPGQESHTVEYALRNFDVMPVPSIDALIKTYVEKGCDRALDLLFEGQFQTFFGLDDQTSSYAGDMQASMRAIAQNDLPIRKTARTDALQARSLSSSDSPDYEFNQSDTEAGVKPDVPT